MPASSPLTNVNDKNSIYIQTSNIKRTLATSSHYETCGVHHHYSSLLRKSGENLIGRHIPPLILSK